MRKQAIELHEKKENPLRKFLPSVSEIILFIIVFIIVAMATDIQTINHYNQLLYLL